MAKIFEKILKVKELVKKLNGEIKISPYFKRVDMPKPIFVRVDDVSPDGDVQWTNQYTSSSSNIVSFYQVHEHVTDDDSILEAEILFEGK